MYSSVKSPKNGSQERSSALKRNWNLKLVGGMMGKLLLKKRDKQTDSTDDLKGYFIIWGCPMFNVIVYCFRSNTSDVIPLPHYSALGTYCNNIIIIITSY